MPELVEPHNHKCEWCGAPAKFISVNAKKYRCDKSPSKCPGIVKKQENSRQLLMSPAERQAEMKRRSISAHKKLKILNEDQTWKEKKARKISDAVIARGGHQGANNPMFGKHHKHASTMKQSIRAQNRDPSCYDRATDTKILHGIAVPKDQKDPFMLYRELVLKYTLRSWKKYQSIINPNNFCRGKEYELDHMYSITQGFIDKIPPEIMGHHCNLRLIPKSANRSKRVKCSITLEELLGNITAEHPI
jgi:hypothetical protein